MGNCERESGWASPIFSPACKKRQKMLPGKLENPDLLGLFIFWARLECPQETCHSEPWIPTGFGPELCALMASRPVSGTGKVFG